MIKEVTYKGYTASPSDYICQDGELSLSMGMIAEDGALKPIMPPKQVLALDSDQSIKHIHHIANYKHYIIYHTSGNMMWWDGTNAKHTLRNFGENTTIHQVTSVGNTLIVLASDGMHYFLYKGKQDGYHYLGTHIPECPISFGLQAEMKTSGTFQIHFDAISKDNLFREFTDNNKRRITEQVLAKVNKFIAENSTNKGKFIYPFLLRYAYRLYDGTLTMHSAPILMIASSDLAPQVLWFYIGGKSEYNEADLEVVAPLHKIDYAVESSLQLDKLQEWKDIVRSVDVFISKPIYTYNQAGECTQFVDVDKSDCYSVCKHINQAVSTETYPLRYQKRTFKQLYAATFRPDSLSSPAGRLMLPRRSEDDVKSDIKNCSQFYHLESIKLEQLTTERTLINVEDEYLQSLVAREQMTDDYDSHDKLIAKYAFAYNSRLNIANLKKELFVGHNPSAMLNYTYGYTNWSPDATPTQTDNSYNIATYIHIKQNGKDIVVKSDAGYVGYQAPILFIYYPNINAYKATIRVFKIGHYDKTFEVPLEQHNHLNGAFFFGGWDNPKTTDTPPPTLSDERTITITNKIYTSEVNNPFHFPLEGINTVGTGEIMGISSAVKALSEGQFGQFPLYAFSTDGVWALEVSNKGTYTAKQPVTRDVCINPKTITQMDNAVLFATDRGIMLISGSTTQCITDEINNETLLPLTTLPHISKLVDMYSVSAVTEHLSIKPLKEYIKECRMIYDYTNQHIVVYNPKERYAYVFSLKSKMWGMIESSIIDSVNSYPEALAVTYYNKLVNLSVSDSTEQDVLIITRPMKLDLPNDMKTVRTAIVRGTFANNKIKTAIYGSRNLDDWHLVWSSHNHKLTNFSGTPYKYFRIVAVGNIDKDDTISSLTIEYTPRLTNKVR